MPRRHFEFNLVRTTIPAHLDIINDHHVSINLVVSKECFRPPGNDKRSFLTTTFLSFPELVKRLFCSYQMPSKQPIAVVLRKSNTSRCENDRKIYQTLLRDLKLENWSLYHCDICQRWQIPEPICNEAGSQMWFNDHEYPSLGLRRGVRTL